MAGRSKVFDLAPELRQELDRLLRERQFTLDEVVAHLRAMTEEQLPSRSSIGRYAQQFEKISERVRRSQEIANRLIDEAGPQIADGKGFQVLLQGFQSLAFDYLANVPEDGSMDAENLMFLAKSIGEVARAQKTDTDRALKIQQETLKRAAAAVKESVGEKGLSPETADFIMQKILGVAG